MSCCRRNRLLRGAAGLAKSALGVDRATADATHRRLLVCEGDGRRPACDRLVLGAVCSECKCIVRAKARVAGETCPLGKWDTPGA